MFLFLQAFSVELFNTALPRLVQLWYSHTRTDAKSSKPFNIYNSFAYGFNLGVVYKVGIQL